MKIVSRQDKDPAELRLDDDRQQLQPVLESLALWATEGGERHPNFWEQQRMKILCRVSALENQRVAQIPRLAWSIALAVVVIASFMLNSGPRVKPGIEPPMDSDRQLLVDIERAMQSGGPSALEPAAMLAEEIGQYENTSSDLQHRQEVSHEE
jgi:hypothetical protein